MSNFSVSENVVNAARVALDGLSARQQAITRNMSNVDTPGYRAQTVSFEKAVKQAIGKSEGLGMSTTHNAHLLASDQAYGVSREYRPGGSLRADLNNVDIDVELVDNMETVTRYETLTNILSRRYRLIKDITRTT